MAPAEPLPAPKVPDSLILLVPRKAGWTAKHWVRQLQNEKVPEQKRSIFLESDSAEDDGLSIGDFAEIKSFGSEDFISAKLFDSRLC